MYRAVIETPLYPVLVAISNSGLVSLVLLSEEDAIRKRQICRLQPTPSQMETIHLTDTENWLDSFFSDKPLTSPEVDISSGTQFQQDIWKTLQTIELGETITYGELAAKAGHNKASRAVGSAMASNPICLIIPCHRVVQSDGKLGNYSGHGGQETKRWLLDHEFKE